MCYNYRMKILKYNSKTQTAEIEWHGSVKTISEEAALRERIDLFSDIAEEKIPLLLAESEKVLCRKYLYDQLSRYSKTKRGYLTKLLEKGFSRDAAREAVNAAEEYGYIDDLRYAERYVEANSAKKGYYRLKDELLKKGVPSSVAAEALDGLTADGEELLALAKKLAKTAPQTREDRAKLCRRLASRGFSYEEINAAVKRLCDGDLDE